MAARKRPASFPIPTERFESAGYIVEIYAHRFAVVILPNGRRVTVKDLLAAGDNNPKTEKNIVETRGLSMAPHKTVGLGNVCPMAKLCIRSCLDTCGRPGDAKAGARTARKALWFLAREWFLAKLHRELSAFRASVPADHECGVRLNMFSDIPYEKFGVPQAHPGITFYDYTKIPSRFADSDGSWILPNYHVTFSYDGTGDSLAFSLALLARGGNVSAVFHEDVPGVCGKGAQKQTLPADFEGFPVFDGSETDWRPADAPGTVCGLVLRAFDYAHRDAAIADHFSTEVVGGSATLLPILG